MLGCVRVSPHVFDNRHETTVNPLSTSDGVTKQMAEKASAVVSSDVHRKRIMRIAGAVVFLAVLVMALWGPVSLARPQTCALCHISRVAYQSWRASSHSSVRCEQCHTDRAAVLGLGNSVALAQNAWYGAVGVQAGPHRVPDSACLACHPAAGLNQPVVVNGLRMSHTGLRAAGYHCVDCHADAAHDVPVARISGPTMSTCAQCHNNTTVSAKCTLCHVASQQATKVAARRTDPEWSKTHGSNWRQLHGMGDLTTCTVCHNRTDCQTCHGMPLPHDDNFIAEHGTIALKSKQLCLNCHHESFCTGCHGFPMPHPADWLPTHPKIAKGFQDPRCIKCHIADDCNWCHTTHVHPHGMAR